MTQNSPTYLYERNGIYYFQLRLPKHLSHTVHNGKTFIRRSTRTGNKHEALKIARKWWAQIMSDNKSKIGWEDMEAILEHEDELYMRGKDLHRVWDSYDDQHDPRAWYEFTMQHMVSPFDEKAFKFYANDLLKTKSQQKSADDESIIVKHSPPPLPAAQQYPSKKLSELVEDYIEDGSSGGKAWRGKTKDKFATQLSIFVDMIGDPITENITVDLISKNFARYVHTIPSNIGSHPKIFYKNGHRKPMKDVIKLADDNNMPRLSPSTIWDYVSNIKSFLAWASKREYLRANLDVAFDKFKKPAPQEKHNRLPFSEDDLKAIFHHDHFTKGKSLHHSPERHWIPLVALYSGARLGEISQLLISDIIKDNGTGIWYINITDEGDKTKNVKTLTSKRQVPVHNSLIKLGFLKYVQHQKDKKQARLFPRFSQDKYGAWGGQVSKWFARHLTNCGVKTDRSKTFHSFRHTVLNYEKQHGLDIHVMSEIVGHAYDQNKVHDGYQQGFDLQRKKKELDKLQYSIDLSKIKKWV